MAVLIRHRNGDALSQWEPFTELSQLAEQLDRYLETGQLARVAEQGFTPFADVEEGEDAYTIEVELPGVRRADVSVEVNGRLVIVTGELKERERKGVVLRRTRRVGRFYYEVVLPGDVADDGVEANLEGGMLTIRVPKAVNERPRRITVS